MDVWLSVLAFVLFLGFGTGALVCVSAVKKQSGIVIKSRLHHKLNISEVVYANLGLVGLVVLVYFKIYIFVPAVLMFVLFIVHPDTEWHHRRWSAGRNHIYRMGIHAVFSPGEPGGGQQCNRTEDSCESKNIYPRLQPGRPVCNR